MDRGHRTVKHGMSSELYIREITQNDFAAIHKIASNPVTCQYTIWGPNTEIDTQNFIAQTLKEQLVDPRTHWTRAICHADAVLGTAAIWITEQKHVELGYMIDPAHWGKGYATQAVQLMLDFAKNKWPRLVIMASTDPANLASQRVLEKSGFQLKEYRKNHKPTSVGWRDSAIFELKSRIDSDIVE